MPALQRVAALVVGLIVVVAIVVVGVTLLDGTPGTGSGNGSSPGTSVGPSGSGEATAEPSASGDAPAPGEEETIAALREIEQQVIAIRGLPAAEIGAPDLITREELGEELERIFAEDYPEEEQAEDNATLRALGLLEQGQDIAELQLQLLGDQVLGFYDDTEKRMVVVTDAGLDPQAKITYAHEYTHALQDAAFGLDSLETDAEGADDRSLARTALIEGDASLAMLAWAFAHLTPEELAAIGTGAPVPNTEGIPGWMVNQLQFPYNEGLIWASAVAGDPFAPDFAAIDAAYTDPPATTEQIIDLESWTDREPPVEVEVPDLAAALGEGWTEVDRTPVGEATIRIMLEYFGIARDDAVAAGDGWGGDTAVVATGPNDAFAVVWRLAWDAPAEADEFADSYDSASASLSFPVSVTRTGDAEVLVVHGSNEEVLRLALAAAGG